MPYLYISLSLSLSSMIKLLRLHGYYFCYWHCWCLVRSRILLSSQKIPQGLLVWVTWQGYLKHLREAAVHLIQLIRIRVLSLPHSSHHRYHSILREQHPFGAQLTMADATIPNQLVHKCTGTCTCPHKHGINFRTWGLRPHKHSINFRTWRLKPGPTIQLWQGLCRRITIKDSRDGEQDLTDRVSPVFDYSIGFLLHSTSFLLKL